MGTLVNIKISEEEYSTIAKMVEKSNGKYDSIEEWLSSAIIEKFLNEHKTA
ncbi:MAG: hypothetical protein V1914_05015 [archaeon]